MRRENTVTIIVDYFNLNLVVVALRAILHTVYSYMPGAWVVWCIVDFSKAIHETYFMADISLFIIHSPSFIYSPLPKTWIWSGNVLNLETCDMTYFLQLLHAPSCWMASKSTYICFFISYLAAMSRRRGRWRASRCSMCWCCPWKCARTRSRPASAAAARPTEPPRARSPAAATPHARPCLSPRRLHHHRI